MFEIKQMTYKEWLRLNPQALDEYACLDCGGSGADICPHCGSELTCEKCGGIGHFARKAYDDAAKKDQKEAFSLGYQVTNAEVI